MNKQSKLGIVLSGGGAKGAYEVGFLKALVELNIQPHAISGTSIGALNGAIYASKRNTKEVYNLLDKLWNDLAKDNVLEIDREKAVKTIVEVLSYFAPIPQTKMAKIIYRVAKGIKHSKSQDGLLTNAPIVDRLTMYAPIVELKSGLPFYVGMTKSKGNLKDLKNFAGLGKDEVIFKHIQSLSDKDMHKAIMASAALPLLFDGLEVEGTVYRDGCLGSTENEWGNTPAKPLVENEKCTHLIVCHLNEGSFFDRHDPLFKNTSIIEVRPTANTFKSGLDPLKFKVSNIDKWIQQGYEDSIRILKESLIAIEGINLRKQAEQLADESLDKLKNRKFELK